MPHYRLELTVDTADQVICEESANYGEAFTCLAIGIALLAFAILSARAGAEDPSRRKLLGTSFGSGLLICCLSLPSFTKSRIIFDREQQDVKVRRSLLGIGWTHRYRLEDIEEVFEGVTPREKDKRLLANRAEEWTNQEVDTVGKEIVGFG
jgi:hypothetical protein